MAETIYTPLDPSQEEIRLFNIVTVAPQIVGELRIVSTLKKPAYSALSYVWGDPCIKEDIIINSEPIKVTRNLARAIEAVQYQWSEGSCADQPLESKWLWADAICINQDDVDEKNNQIPFMTKIYSNAFCVFSWIGQPSHCIKNGFAVFALAASAMRSEGAVELGGVTWARRNQLEGFFRVIHEFLTQDYWSRVWILQELILGTDIVLISGQESLSWSHVDLFSLWYYSAVSRSTYGRELKPDNIDDASWYFIQNKLLPCLLLIRYAKSLTFELSRVVDGQTSTSLQRPRNIWYDELLKAKYQATDPRDYVYGFAGLLGLNIKADYSPTKTVADVYCDLTMAWIQPFKDGVCEIQDFTILNYAGIGYFWEMPPGLPSWAPNFIGIVHVAKEVDAHRVSCQRSVLDNAFTDSSPALIIERSLHCSVMVVDHIDHLGPCFDVRSYHDKPEWSCWLLEVILQRHLDGSSSRHKVIAFLDAIWDVDRRRCGEAASEQHRSVFSIDGVIGHVQNEEHTFFNIRLVIHELYKIWNKPYGEDAWEKFFDALHLEDESLRPTTAGSDHIVWRNRPAKVAFEDSFDWVGGSKHLAFMHDREGLRLAETKHGFFGMFPPKTEPSDTIAVLKGCSHSILLRKMGERYALVGVCYVSGYMINDLGSLMKERGTKVEYIEIC